MKTTIDIYEQENRVSKLLFAVTSYNIKSVHPETGGSLHLAHNWGNEAAQRYLDIHRDRQSKLYYLFQTHYKIAFKRQYPEHSSSKY